VISAWRIVKERYAHQAFDGEGSRLNGTRWTSRGISVTLVSQSLSLAALEILVHLGSARPLPCYVTSRVEFDEALVSHLDHDLLPVNSRTFPAPPELQAIGDAWVRGQDSAILRVPSVVIDAECNYIVNPDHPDIERIIIHPPEQFAFDSRVHE
jgi:RES domain-containing protein